MIQIRKCDLNPITSIGEVAGICWGADTKDKTKNYKRGIDCLKNNHGRVMEYTDIEVIDYQCKFIDDDYKPIIDFSSLKRFIVSALSFFPIVIRNLKFNKALKTTVKLSKSYNINTINDADVYDCYIAGSDMIWHWHTVKGEEKFDETYFLSFVKISL